MAVGLHVEGMMRIVIREAATAVITRLLGLQMR